VIQYCWSTETDSQYTGWPKKVSHSQESSLNRIKNRQGVYISYQFWV